MLNNHGWGYRAYIIASSVILLFLIIVTFFVIRLYRGFAIVNEVPVDSATYSDLEENLNNLSIKYVNEFKDGKIDMGVITVSTKTLLNEHLLNSESLKINDDKCNGYSLVRKNEDDILYSESYIRCNSYTTDGYQAWRVE